MYLKRLSTRSFNIFPLRSPSAHSEMNCFGLTLYPPPPPKKNPLGKCIPEGAEGEIRGKMEGGGGAKHINFDEKSIKNS